MEEREQEDSRKRAAQRLKQLSKTISPEHETTTASAAMTFPAIPRRAAYLFLDNARQRNALSLAVLRDLRAQLYRFNTSPVDGKLRILPPFQPSILSELEAASASTSSTTSSSSPSQDSHSLSWLLSDTAWRTHRAGLPTVLVLRSGGPVFSSGHNLKELKTLSHAEVKETFALCAEVMSLIRRSPAPVVCVVQGLATAAGAQLALTCDLPVAAADTPFRLPGQSLGLPCTSPVTAVSRRFGPVFAYRMSALAEPVAARNVPGGGVDVVVPGPGENGGDALEKRVAHVVATLAASSGQAQALGKWAFWTQVGMNGQRSGDVGGGGSGSGGDGYEDAVAWTGRVMALHARSADAREGLASFFEKRAPEWKT